MEFVYKNSIYVCFLSLAANFTLVSPRSFFKGKKTFINLDTKFQFDCKYAVYILKSHESVDRLCILFSDSK